MIKKILLSLFVVALAAVIAAVYFLGPQSARCLPDVPSF